MINLCQEVLGLSGQLRHLPSEQELRSEYPSLLVIPLGEFGAPEDIAYGILYLISDESRFVTGTELVIDGGMNAI